MRANAIFLLKENEIDIIGTSDKGSLSLYKHEVNLKTALIIGSEGKGISKSVLSLCNEVVGIEMKGNISSLNASVATGIFISELAKEL